MSRSGPKVQIRLPLEATFKSQQCAARISRPDASFAMASVQLKALFQRNVSRRGVVAVVGMVQSFMRTLHAMEAKRTKTSMAEEASGHVPSF
jgi:hypothetical protein